MTPVLLVLRKLDNKNRWRRAHWLVAGGAPADALTDLRTTGNALSVWYVDDQQTRLKPLIAAIAATRDHVDPFEYALFESQHLTRLNIKISPVQGNTPDREANQWHINLQELSAEKLAKLAEVIMSTGSVYRLLDKEVLQLIRQAVLAGRIDRATLKLGVGEKLEREMGRGSAPAQ